MDRGAALISTALPNLTVLLLGTSLIDEGNNKVQEIGATSIAMGLSNLTELDISSNAIGDNGITGIAERLKNLRVLRAGKGGITKATAGYRILEQLILF